MVKKAPYTSVSNEKTNFLIDFFQWILDICYRFPKVIIIVFLTLLIVAFFGLARVKLELDIYDVKNSNFISSLNWFKLREEFKDPNSLYLVWNPSNSIDSNAHCKWQNALQMVKNKEDGVSRVFQVYSLREPRDVNGDLLYQKMMTDPCENPIQKSTFEKIQKSYLGPISLDSNVSSFLTEISFDSSPIEVVEQVSKTLISTNKLIDPNGSIRYLGPLSYRMEFKKILSHDAYLNIALLIFIAIFFRFFLGTWLSGLIYILATITTIIFTIGFMSCMGYPIDILTNNLILMTAIAGTADFLFLSFEFFKFNPKVSFNNIITGAFFTTFTTIVGFLSLYFADLDMIKRFGIAAAIGAFFEWAVLFTLVPAIMKLCNFEKTWVNKERAYKIFRFKKMMDFIPSKSIVYSFLVFSIAAFAAWPFLNYSDSPKNNFPESHPLRVSIEDFKNRFRWEGNISLLFNKSVSDEDINKIQEKIKNYPLVFFVESKNELLKSWTSRFDSITRRELITRDFETSTLNTRFESLEYKRSIIYLKNVNTVELEKFQKYTSELCGDKCMLSGQVLVYLELNKRVSHTMIESFVTSIVLVLLVIFILMKILNIKEAKFRDVAISSLIAPLFMMTLIVFIQVPVNVVTSIFFASLVGLTGDNAIQFLFASYGASLDKGMELRGEASLVFSLMLILGSLFFIGQTLIPLKWLGALFSFGFLITFIGDYWILKGLRFSFNRKS